ncbi:hypothetical protein [Acinetobacter sp. Marseille-Q1618]|uniref:hypothetical protein n=1 Tax=Acinetobacter sp. Marseille-Q1618 TaxID=2697502 RepID=UPI00156F1321|nr:hypothetical protein [Acinetobacter sp. Marseille-Q1618]
MTWVVVSFINVLEVTEGTQTEFPVEESFVLFNFNTQEELNQKIQAHIDLINGAGAEGMTYYDQPAKEYCLGVRKIKDIFNEDPLTDDDPPGDRTELTHSYMTVQSLQDAKLLAEGKAVQTHYIDDDPLE